MSDGEKDRFGDTLRDAEKAREDQFFAERDRQLLQKLKGGDAAPEPQSGTTPTVVPAADEPRTTTPEPTGWLSRLLGRSR